MTLSINTNIASLNAQTNLGKSQNSLEGSLKRLSSGLRINSAKDDAAGLAISNRMSSQVRGLNQAARNANDAISMSQTAEGALQESTNILQRIRELAIQSANDTNSASDRSSLQAEVNQLKAELTRIAETTTFNGRNLLDGSLSSATFHIGSEANETISLSIEDMTATGLGNNSVSTNDTIYGNATYGIEVATRNTQHTTDGDDIGLAVNGDSNAIAAQTITVKDSDGSTVGSVDTTLNDTIETTAASLAAIDGVTTSAYSQITLDSVAKTDHADDASLTITTDGQTLTVSLSADSGVDAAASADAIEAAYNAATDAVKAAMTITRSGNEITFTNATGDDFDVVATGTGNTTLTGNVTGTDGSATSVGFSGTDSADTVVTSGKMEVFLAEGYTIESDEAQATSYFDVAADTANTADASNIAIQDVTDNTNNLANYGNSVASQILTLVGPDGTDTATIGGDLDARGIASAVNAVSSSTGITATATTEATLGGLTADGTISFNLFGQNSSAVSISATVKSDDLTSLVNAINEETGTTGISAELGSDTSTITLSNSSGYDIKIAEFAHSASTTTTVSGSTVQSMDVTGGSGSAVKLYDGGYTLDGQDSTVIGGTVKFSASDEFQISSSVAGTSAVGGNSSLFTGSANAASVSDLSSVNEIDITTREGANEAIEIATAALSQIDVTRGDLGAIQNRFESTIANLQSVSENISAAQSRILDADFAAETAAMTKAQILQQAGVAMLAQANQLPQAVLSLLQ